MTRDDDFIGQLEGYLDEFEGVTPLPAAVRTAVRAQLPTTRQRGGLQRAMGFLTANRPLQIALAAVAALAFGLAALSALNSRIGTEPTPTAHPSGDLGIFEPVAGRIVYGDESGIWGVDPTSAADPATRVQLRSEGTPLGWSSDGTRLLIMGHENLFVLDADGSETLLAEATATGKRATISPDGSHVVFEGPSDTPEAECCGRALYIVDTDGGPARMLREAHAADLAFSPDGTQIVYVDWGGGDHNHPVWLMDADGSNAHQIVSNDVTLGGGHVRGLAWSPTGDRIALGLESSIYTFATDGSGFTRVITDGVFPYWSPDGSRVAYTVGFQSNFATGTLAIADADGSNVRRFGFGTSGPWHPGRGVYQPTPSVDLVTPTDIAVRIVYLTSTDGGGMFYLFPEGSETQAARLTEPRDIRGVTISRDGTLVVFAGGAGAFPGEPTSCCARGFALYSVDAEGGPAELLVESRNGFVERPTFAPDGTQIAYVDGVGDNNHHVWLIGADGSDAHEIWFKDCACHVDGLAWSPAGDRLTLVLEGTTYSFASDGSDLKSE